MPRAIISGFVLVVCLSSLQAFSNPNQMDSNEALRIVEEYRILRNMCSTAKDKARKACFAELGEKSDVYSKAKKILQNNENLNNVHMVTVKQ